MSVFPKKTFFRLVGSGEDVQRIAVELDTLDLVIALDLLSEANRTAALMGMAGDFVAEWKQRVEDADAYYRQWRGQAYLHYKAALPGTSRGAASDDHVKAAIDADPAFLTAKLAYNQALSELTWLESYHGALNVKAQLIRSRISLEIGDRSAMDRFGDVPIPRSVPPAPLQMPNGPKNQTREERDRQVHEAMHPRAGRSSALAASSENDDETTRHAPDTSDGAWCPDP